jgi:hypothetical protein
MSKLLNFAIASALACGLSTAIAQPVVQAGQQAGDFKILNDNCTSLGGAGRSQCRKDFRSSRADAGCEELTDRDKRECMLDAFVKKHDGTPAAPLPPREQR